MPVRQSSGGRRTCRHPCCTDWWGTGRLEPARGPRRRRGMGRLWPRLAAAAVLSVVAVGVVTGPAHAAQSGASNEGPYPWKYPASGTVKVGSGKTIGGQPARAGAHQFNSAYADPCIAKWSRATTAAPPTTG